MNDSTWKNCRGLASLLESDSFVDIDEALEKTVDDLIAGAKLAALYKATGDRSCDTSAAKAVESSAGDLLQVAAHVNGLDPKTRTAADLAQNVGPTARNGLQVLQQQFAAVAVPTLLSEGLGPQQAAIDRVLKSATKAETDAKGIVHDLEKLSDRISELHHRYETDLPNQQFKNEAELSTTRARIWIGAAVVVLTLTVGGFWWHAATRGKPSWEFETWILAVRSDHLPTWDRQLHILLERFFILSIGVYGVSFCLLLSRANWTSAAHYRHRQLALEVYPVLLAPELSADVKQQISEAAARCVFEDRPSGFLGKHEPPSISAFGSLIGKGKG
ncbi:MAG: hypothetical protein GY711_11420 [bacterium]|nr:hypothetical protein [bacterium]